MKTSKAISGPAISIPGEGLVESVRIEIRLLDTLCPAALVAANDNR